jgi:predicted  nucleic acid-binding Zn-ribbon protein
MKCPHCGKNAMFAYNSQHNAYGCFACGGEFFPMRIPERFIREKEAELQKDRAAFYTRLEEKFGKPIDKIKVLGQDYG